MKDQSIQPSNEKEENENKNKKIHFHQLKIFFFIKEISKEKKIEKRIKSLYDFLIKPILNIKLINQNEESSSSNHEENLIKTRLFYETSKNKYFLLKYNDKNLYIYGNLTKYISDLMKNQSIQRTVKEEKPIKNVFSIKEIEDLIDGIVTFIKKEGVKEYVKSLLTEVKFINSCYESFLLYITYIKFITENFINEINELKKENLSNKDKKNITSSWLFKKNNENQYGIICEILGIDIKNSLLLIFFNKDIDDISKLKLFIIFNHLLEKQDLTLFLKTIISSLINKTERLLYLTFILLFDLESLFTYTIDLLLSNNLHEDADKLMKNINHIEKQYVYVINQRRISLKFNFLYKKYEKGEIDFACFVILIKDFPFLLEIVIKDLSKVKDYKKIEYIIYKSNLNEKFYKKYIVYNGFGNFQYKVNDLINEFEVEDSVSKGKDSIFRLSNLEISKNCFLFVNKKNISSLSSFIYKHFVSLHQKISNKKMKGLTLNLEDFKYIVSIDTETAFGMSKENLKFSILQMSICSMEIFNQSQGQSQSQSKEQDLSLIMNGYILNIIIDLQSISPKLLSLELEEIFKYTEFLLGFGLSQDLKSFRKLVKNEIFNKISIFDFSLIQKLGTSLKKQVKFLINKDLSKGCQLSNWNLRPLLPQQIHYAICDSYVLILMYRIYKDRYEVTNDYKQVKKLEKRRVLMKNHEKQ